MKKYTILIFVAIAVIVAGLSFEGGILYQKNKNKNSMPSGMPTDMAGGNISNSDTTSSGNTSGRNGTPPSGTAPNGNGGRTSGTIVSKDDESITIKTSDGSSMVIYYSDSTTVTKSSTASLSDLVTGSEISVMGSTNSDKSVTAKEITVK